MPVTRAPTVDLLATCNRRHSSTVRKYSLRGGRAEPFLLKTGTALGVSWRSWIAVGFASRVVDFGIRLLDFSLLFHCLTCRRVRRAIAAGNGIQALDGMPGAATENK